MDFLEAVGSLRFRGTSVLFRLPVSIINLAQDEMYESLTGDHISRLSNISLFVQFCFVCKVVGNEKGPSSM